MFTTINPDPPPSPSNLNIGHHIPLPRYHPPFCQKNPSDSKHRNKIIWHLEFLRLDQNDLRSTGGQFKVLIKVV